MAKNTGRGSRYAAASSTAGQFVRAKEHGGAFKGVRRADKPDTWWSRLWRR